MSRIQLIDSKSNKTAWTRYEPIFSSFLVGDGTQIKRIPISNAPNELLNLPKVNWYQNCCIVPTMIQIQLTSRCNHKCSICYASSLKASPKPAYMPLSKLLILL